MTRFLESTTMLHSSETKISKDMFTLRILFLISRFLSPSTFLHRAFEVKIISFTTPKSSVGPTLLYFSFYTKIIPI